MDRFRYRDEQPPAPDEYARVLGRHLVRRRESLDSLRAEESILP